MAEKPTIPDFPTLQDFSQMITQACEVVASVRGIPYDFNGTLSLENKFVVLFKTVKEMFDAQDELVKSYKALYDFVNQFFTNLDLQTEVNKKIEEMFENGILTNIIQNLITFPANDIRMHYYGMTQQDFENTFPQRALQGGCFINENNFISAYITNDTEKTLLVEYSNGTVTRTSNTINCGHANGITFDGTFLYVVGDVAPYQLDLFKINYETLELEEIIKLPGNDASYQYGDICYYNSKFYLINSAGNDSNIKLRITSDFKNFETYTLGAFNWCSVFTIYNDNIMLFGVNNTVNCYNINTLKQNFSFTLNRNVNYNFVTEIEWADVLNGNIYCAFNIEAPTKDGNWRQKTFLTYFNPYNNEYTGLNEKEPVNVTVYVDSSYNQFDRNGTISKPFATIEEALNCYYNTNIETLNVTLKKLNDNYNDLNIYNLTKKFYINNESENTGRIIVMNSNGNIANYKVNGVHGSFPDFAVGYGMTLVNSNVFIHNGGTIEALKVDTSSKLTLSFTNVNINGNFELSGVCIAKSNSVINTVTSSANWNNTRGTLIGNLNFCVVPANANTIEIPVFSKMLMLSFTLNSVTYNNIIVPINTETGYITIPLGSNTLILDITRTNKSSIITFNTVITNARFSV